MFEVGKTYKTRDGRDALVVDVYPEAFDGYTVSARVNGRWHTFTLEGRCYKGEENPIDLILPPIVMYANIYPENVQAFTGCLYSDPEKAREYANPAALRIAVPVEVPNL